MSFNSRALSSQYRSLTIYHFVNSKVNTDLKTYLNPKQSYSQNLLHVSTPTLPEGGSLSLIYTDFFFLFLLFSGRHTRGTYLPGIFPSLNFENDRYMFYYTFCHVKDGLLILGSLGPQSEFWVLQFETGYSRDQRK